MKIEFPLFKNKRKEKPNQPDYQFFDKEKGIEVAAWIKKKGDLTYMSVVYKDGDDVRSYPSNSVPVPSGDHQDTPF